MPFKMWRSDRGEVSSKSHSNHGVTIASVGASASESAKAWMMPAVTATEADENEKPRTLSRFFTRAAASKSLGRKRASAASASSQSEKDIGPWRIEELAKTIREETDKIAKYMQEQGLPEPTLDVLNPATFPDLTMELRKCRHRIITASKEMTTLITGPRETVRWTAWSFLDALSLQFINAYDVAADVPLSGTIGIAELSRKTNLDEVNLARMLRHTMTNHIFAEPQTGRIAHTALSRQLADTNALRQWVGFNTEEVFPAASRMLEAITREPKAESPMHAGFNYAFNTVEKESMFVTLAKDKGRSQRMAEAMSSLTNGEGYELHHLVNTLDLAPHDNDDGVFVDMGGNHGFVSVKLAEEYKKMKFIVQDLPSVIASAPSPVHTDKSICDRICLEAHDFTKQQPVIGADVYFFRWIFHNYSRPWATKILKQIVPALKSGSRVIINDYCVGKSGSEKPEDERVLRGMDLVMGALLNSQERSEEEYRELFKLTDPRFSFIGVTRPKESKMSIVEAIWDPDPVISTPDSPDSSAYAHLHQASPAEEVGSGRAHSKV